MENSNIEDFDKTVGLVFARLYQDFPIRQVIDPTILDSIVRVNTEGWESRYQHHQKIFIATMIWLIEAGYLWASPVRDESSGVFLECVLSTKGLEVLNTPSSLGKTIGSTLKEAALSTSGDTIKDLAKEALTAGASFAMGFGRSLIGT